MATQAELITNIRERIDESTATFWTDAELRRWINEGAKDLARRGEVLQTSSTVAAVVAQQEYDAPSDVVRIHRMEYQATGDDTIYFMEPREYNNMDTLWLTHKGITTSWPRYYTLWGHPGTSTLKLVVYPKPATVGEFTFYYYKLPALLNTTDATSAASTVEVPNGWDDLVVDYAEFHALRKDGDPRWQEARQIYEARIDNLFVLSRAWHDQSSEIVHDSPLGLPAWLTDYSYMDY